MKSRRFLGYWLVLWAVLFGTLWTVAAYGQTVPLSRPSSYVTDSAHILSPAALTSLEQQLSAYAQTSTNEIAVVTVPTLSGVSVEEAATKLFHSWGIGKADKDNGVLLFWSTGDRKVRIEVGYGLEQALPDGRAGQIIRDTITPAFRAQAWNKGVLDGVGAIIRQLETQPAVSVLPAPGTGLDVWWVVLLGVLLIGGPIAGVCLLIAHTRQKHEDDRQAYLWTGTGYRKARLRPLVLSSTPYEPSSSPSTSDTPYVPSTPYDGPSSPSVDTSSSFGGFGGGDSGGGGASGSY